MISSNKVSEELELHTQSILKLLKNSEKLDAGAITLVIYQKVTANNRRKTLQLLHKLAECKKIRFEKAKHGGKDWMLFDTILTGKQNFISPALVLELFTGHKPVLTNADIAIALHDKASSTALHRAASITKKMSNEGLLKKEIHNRLPHYALPTFDGKISDYAVNREENNQAVDDAQNSERNLLMQKALIFYRTLAQFNPQAIG